MSAPELVCAYCGRPMLGLAERCSGTFTDKDHPPLVPPVAKDGTPLPAPPPEREGPK